MPKASSCMLVLPMMMAPAARNLAATGASFFGTNPFSAGVPALLGNPATSILSLMTMGTPPSSLQPPFLRLASNAAAAFVAPASSRVMKALSLVLALARAIAADVSAVLVILPAQMSAAALAAVSVSKLGAVCAVAGTGPAAMTRLATAEPSKNLQ